MPSASEPVSTAVCFLYIIGEAIHFLVNPYYQVLACLVLVLDDIIITIHICISLKGMHLDIRKCNLMFSYLYYK